MDSKNDGAKPIDNRRVIEDDVTKFSSMNYIELVRFVKIGKENGWTLKA
ncbi:hypothetical protein [Candidatus Tisiphia endosymbiont of Thecophora atra]